ncbi:hypothetical protein [Kitasatospora indigofera]|uniref:hypothetical protein n=1 Tax=Kitasatospora indigofera TaxID=67307 RepID=UPI003249ADC7
MTELPPRSRAPDLGGGEVAESDGQGQPVGGEDAVNEVIDVPGPGGVIFYVHSRVLQG